MTLTEDEKRRWLATRPRKVREILARWPLNSTVTDGMRRFWVLGATEEGGLIITPVDPNHFYDRAKADRRICCADCLKARRLHLVGEPHA